MKRGRQQTFGWEELEWYDLKKIVTFWRKKKRLALRDMTTKYHIFVIIFWYFPKKTKLFLGDMGGRICKKKKLVGKRWLIQKFSINIALKVLIMLGSIKKCWLSQRLGEGKNVVVLVLTEIWSKIQNIRNKILYKCI